MYLYYLTILYYVYFVYFLSEFPDEFPPTSAIITPCFYTGRPTSNIKNGGGGDWS